jgi:ABC-type antimicrobial peptide transport system permease subunit
VLYARTTAEPASLVWGLRRAVQSVEPNLPLPDLQPVTETVASSLYASRMAALLLGAFALLAAALAGIGVYGVTSFAIAQRTREIGVRMALGARGNDVVRLVLGQGLRVVGVGLAIGLGLALAAGRSIEGFLYGVSGRDLLTFATVPVLLAVVAAGACLLPARRAASLDPLSALRQR